MYSVSFSPEAVNNLDNLYEYLSYKASSAIADGYIGSILDTCDKLGQFPFLGISRDDIRTGLRITHHRGKTMIAFSSLDDRIIILGIFHGGQNWESRLERAIYGDDDLK